MIAVNCDYCGKEFQCQEWRVRKRKHIFCSRDCSGAFTHKQNKNITKCSVCGKLMYLKPSYVKKTKQPCCSYECAGRLRETIYLGENNPNYGNRGSLNPIWKSDTKISPYGYILVRVENHPFKNCDGFVFEHRLVAERYLLNDENSIEIDGEKYLKPEYDVHHKDRNRTNNNPDNLEVMTRSEHMKLHQQENKELQIGVFKSRKIEEA